MLEQWVMMNSMVINSSKTKAILFRPKSKNASITAPLLYNSTNIEFVTSFKTLGVTFSEHMTWEHHINLVCTKLARAVGVVQRHRFILPTKVKLLLYNSLFYSHISYGYLVWGTTGLTNLEKIHRLQKKMMRAICNSPYQSHSSPIFRKLSVIKIFNLYDYRLSLSYICEIGRAHV